VITGYRALGISAVRWSGAAQSRRWTSRAVVASLVAGALVWIPAVPASAAAATAVSNDKSVPVSAVKGAGRGSSQEMAAWEAKAPKWPSPGAVTVDLPVRADGSGRAAADASVGGLTVRVEPVEVPGGELSPSQRAAYGPAPSKVRVEVAEHGVAMAAGVPLALRVSRADGVSAAARLRVTVSYADFEDAYGGDWKTRLRLVLLPACALTSPNSPDCVRQTPLPSTNLVGRSTVAADVDVDGAGEAVSTPVAEVSSSGGQGGGVGTGLVDMAGNPLTADPVAQSQDTSLVVALAAATSSDTGDFGKTKLSQTGSWAAGESGGGFSWSYPLQSPPVPGGLSPKISLGYSSSAVDGQTASQNSQPGWLGQGWDYSPGFIERSYRACRDDSANSPHWTVMNTYPDMCWRMDNAHISWNGHSTELIPEGTTGSPNTDRPTVWHLADDPGTKVQRIDRSNVASEYWKLTTTDGTQYYFGLVQLPGYQSGDRTTVSTVQEPVFANHASEPCYNSSSASSSWCLMTYKWMLDYVVDPHGNSMAYFYNTAAQKAGWQANTTATWYNRDIWLVRIEYGMRAGQELATANPPAEVVFATSDRCNTGSCGTHTAANWPDTPWDMDCQAGTSCPAATPVFWSSNRLASVTTQVYNGTGYSTVDTWSLYSWFPVQPSHTGATDPWLWLDKISHTGTGGFGPGILGNPVAVSMPDVQIFGINNSSLRQRAAFNTAAGLADPWLWRVYRIDNEFGGRVEATYSAQDSGCISYTSPPDPDNNPYRCFPKQLDGSWVWWHKYVVTKVVESDLVGGSPPIEHNYTYALSTTVGGVSVGTPGGVLWHHDMDAWGATLTYRSWSEFAGYPVVIEVTGATGATQSKKMTLYFTGLQGDRTDAGDGTRSSQLTDSLGGTYYNFDWRKGVVRETLTFQGNTGTLASQTINNPIGATTASRSLTSAWAVSAPVTATMQHNGSIHEYTSVAATSSWREKATIYTYDQYNNVTQVNGIGDTAVGTDDTCTTTEYLYNTGLYIVDKPRQTYTQALTCDLVMLSDPLLSGAIYVYDQPAAANPDEYLAPTKGDVTRTRQVLDPNWGYITTSEAEFDQFGRPTKVKDALGNPTTTAYTQTNGQTTQITVTNALGHQATSVLNAPRGLPVTVTDANGKVTTAQYDRLGRLLKVWKPGHLTSGTPDAEYAYTLTPTGSTTPTYVTSKILGPDGSQVTSYEIFDGLLRTRETQTPVAAVARTISETAYDSRGLAVKTSMYYNTASSPTSTLVTTADSAIESQHRYTYDGLARQTADELWSGNVKKWTVAATSYDGDRITVDTAAGGTDTTAFFDAFGRTTELWQYQASTPTGVHDTTKYEYDKLGNMVKTTGPDGAVWTHTYDPLGRKTNSVDPDTGTTATVYDNAGHITSTTDGRNQKLVYEYDALGRTTKEFAGSVTDANQRAEWIYDTVAKGQLYRTYRFPAGAAGAAYSVTNLALDDGYRPLTVNQYISSAEGTALGGKTYTTSYTYKTNGAVATSTTPTVGGVAVGGLPAETLTYTYNSVGQPTGLSGLQTYVASTAYTYDGQLAQQILGTAGKQVRHTYTYETDTRRLQASQVDTENQSALGTWVDKATDEYGFDQAGNVQWMATKNNAVRDQAECFDYDYLRRLTDAWTEATVTCSSASKQKTGVDAYRLSWTFDVAGNRKTETSYNADGTSQYQSTYAYGGTGKPLHSLASVTTTGLGAGTNTYNYDAAGNTTSRPGLGGAQQALTWDEEGKLTKVADSTETTMVYDTDGNRVVRRDPGGYRTVYLTDGTELRANADGSVAATRYYGGVAVRTANVDTSGNLTSGDTLTWTITDHHGTGSIAINASTLSCQRRRSLPYGGARGTQPGGFGSKGFVGGTNDPTGLTHVGAREYDPSVGRFISIDPMFDLSDPQSWNGYAYANNAPITSSDPSGLNLASDGGSDGGPAAPQTPPPSTGCLPSSGSASCSQSGTGGSGGSGGGAGGSGGSGGGSGGPCHIKGGCPTTTTHTNTHNIQYHVDPNSYRSLCVDAEPGWGDCETGGLVDGLIVITVAISAVIDVILALDPIPGDEVAAGAAEVRLIKAEQSLANDEGLPYSAETLSINSRQFGQKWGQHAGDFGLDVSSAEARAGFETRVRTTYFHPEEVRVGSWNPSAGGGTDYVFSRSGNMIVVTKNDGTFVTTLNSSIGNGWWDGASVVLAQ